MGVVYRARDTRLYRDVALKVLPQEFAQDQERIARSQREARLLASLNHPNIAAIYDLKEWEGNRCLVLEYVEGENLAERLLCGAPPIREALSIGLQIADALEAAHRAGVVHRDIKPANIKVGKDGRVKVLDFGLAKSVTIEDSEPEASIAPTLVTQMLAGKILGTPAYMSPEQVRGESADKRADIWSFGCLLYELMAGRQVFPGTSIHEILACVLKSDPDWTLLPRETPSTVRNLLRRCLEKDPNLRLDDTSIARIEIEAGIHQRTKPTESEPTSNKVITSLAVLPFVNTGSAEMEYLSDGLTESIILSLSQVPHLSVISRSAVFRHKGRQDEAQKAGRELGVAAVLTGRVAQRQDALVISAELVDVENGWQLWGDQYRRKSADIFAIEEDIAREISENLRLKLAPEKNNAFSRRYTDNVEAYHLYLKGRFHWGKRTAEGLNRGIQYFRQAIEGDPTYALAYAGLAEGYVPLGIYCHRAPKDAFPKARSAAEKALEIDPGLSEALTVLATVKNVFDWDPAGGEKDARAAIDLNSSYPRARQVLSECLSASGRPVEAVVEVKRALDLDPLSLHMNAAVALTCYSSRRYEESVEYALRSIELDPIFFPGYFYLGLAQDALGQYSEAVAALEKAVVLSTNSTLMLAALGGALAGWKKEDEARKVLLELESLRRQKYVSQVFVAAIHARLGESSAALDCLERAYEDRCAWLRRCLLSDPRLDVLRGETRFRNILGRVAVLRT
jgi:serine/threonine protein kinase/Tfp pilus assembly protein PilF